MELQNIAQSGRSSLPSLRSLASEWCARQGFDMKLRGAVPASGAIYWVEGLTFDQGVVLLSFFDGARVYIDGALDTPQWLIRSLSVRVASCITDAGVLACVVNDLAHDRVVIVSGTHAAQLRDLRSLRAPLVRLPLGGRQGEFQPSLISTG